jgi:signal transduction histidine kinase
MNGRGPRRGRTRAASPPAEVLVVLTAAAAALSVAVVVFVLRSAPPHDRDAAAIVHGLQVAVPAAVALAALARSPTDRFARALLGVGVLGATTALTESTDPTLYSLGRSAVWLVEPSLVFLLLAFPSGRLTGVGARRTLVGAVLVVGLLWVPTVPLVQSYPVPSPWAVTCGLHCPANALAVTSSEPGIVDVLRPVREALSWLVMVATAVLLVRRRRTAGPLLRIALLPVVAIAFYRAAALGGYFGVRAVDGGAQALGVVGWLYLLSLPLLALAFAAGLVLRDARASTAIQRLALRVGPEATPLELRRGLSRALDDPALRVLILRSAEDGPWTDEMGAPAASPEMASAGTSAIVRTNSGQAVALVVDEALGHDPAILRAAATYALVLLENGRLIDRLRASMSDLARSRSRAIAIADETRRRIERDLHDGAQQRLIALRIRLSAEGEALEEVDPRAAEALALLGADVEDALDELRALAHGVYPSVLSDRGLPDALRAVARQTALSTTVDADGVGRYPTEVETTVYFAVLESIQNAEKHARGATQVRIELRAGDDGELLFGIADDGAGFDASGPSAGSGLAHLRDRLGAIGGSLIVVSAPDAGTTIRGTVPTPLAVG